MRYHSIYLFLYFVLWTSATIKAQVLVKDINDKPFTGANIKGLTVFKNKVYFQAEGRIPNTFHSYVGLHVSDGTPNGTSLLKNNTYFGNNKPALKASDSFLFFASYESGAAQLWKSDGTENGTDSLKTFGQNTIIYDIYCAGNKAYISVFIPEVGHELWLSDGTTSGTVKIRDFYRANTSDIRRWDLYFLAHINNNVFFVANDNIHGFELWKTSGSVATTSMVKDINRDTINSDGNGLGVDLTDESAFVVVNNQLYFAATDTSDYPDGIWRTDGTEGGTIKIKGFRNDRPASFVNVGNHIYFRQFLTNLNKLDINTNDVITYETVGGGFTTNTVYFKHQGNLYYSISSWGLSANYTGLYRWNAAADSGVLLRLFYSIESTPLSIGDKIYFIARDTDISPIRHFWVSDGTVNGTKKVFANFDFPIEAKTLFDYNGKLLLTAYDNMHGTELWKYSPNDSLYAPKPKFDVLQNGNFFAMVNQSLELKSPRWWYDFGSWGTDTVKHPIREFGRDSMLFTLVAGNDYGFFPSSKKIFFDKNTVSCTPLSGANEGYTTCIIRGLSFTPSVKVFLTKSNTRDIEPENIAVRGDSLVEARLFLKGKSLGKYNIYLINGLDTVRLKDSFEITTAAETYNLNVSLTGPLALRRLQKGEFSVFVTNYENRDAYMVPVYVTGFPADTALVVTYTSPELTNFPSERGLDTLARYLTQGSYKEEYQFIMYTEDSTERYLAAVIPVLKANSIERITFDVTLTSTHIFDLNLTPMVSQPTLLNDSSFLRSALSPCHQKALECAVQVLTDVAQQVIKKQDCLKTSGSSIVKGAIQDPNQPGSRAKTIKESLSVGLNVLSCAADLYPPALGAKIALKVAKSLVKAYDYSTCSELGNKCRKKEPPTPRRTGGSGDPNEKVASGYGPLHAINDGENISYTIKFENMPTASIPAAKVLIIDTLDKTKLDLSSLQFTTVGFGDTVLTNKNINGKDFLQFVDLRPNKSFIVSIFGSLDTAKGILKWEFNSLKPNDLTPIDDLDGFLPPNLNAPEGEGFVKYSIKAKSSLPNATIIKNQAAIYFDYNEPIFTNTFSNTVDLIKPDSKVNPNPNRLNDTTALLTITGTDNIAGIDNYAIYVSINDSAYTLWRIIETNQVKFTGIIGKRYKFYSIATDGVGNIELPPLNPLTNPDASIQLLPTKATDITADGVVISVFPNPVKQDLYLNFTFDRPSQVSWKIIDILGKVYFEKRYDSSLQGQHQDQWHTQNLTSGVYLLSIKVNGQSFVRRFVVEQ